MNKPSILIIDDEEDIVKSLKRILLSENMNVDFALSGEKGIDLAHKNRPDIIILDLRLPDIDGFDVCQRLKKSDDTSDVPILMLTTRAKDAEKAIGLELGADDYLTKPYSDVELMARIRVILRRQKSARERENKRGEKIYELGLVTVNTETRQVTVSGKKIKTTRKEFELLSLLMSKPGKVFQRRFLLEAVWGYDVDSLQSTLDSHIGTLRKKLGSASKHIETVTGIGFRWSNLDS